MNVLSVPPATATANTKGEATFAFPTQPSLGDWWYVSCSVQTAPGAAQFQLLLSGTAKVSWVGSQPSASVVIVPGTRVSVKATGLVGGQTYVAQLTGGWTTGSPQGIPPAGPSSFALTTITTTKPITIEGTVDAEITGGTVDVGTVESVGSITETVTVEGSVDATVTGTVDANITNASIDVTGTLDANITNATLPVEGSVTANITNAAINVGSVGTISDTVTVEGTNVGVVNVIGTALTTADAQDFLYHGPGATPTSTPTPLTVYGSGTTLVTAAPSTSQHTHGATPATLGLWYALWNPNTVTSPGSVVPDPDAAYGMTYGTVLTGKHLAAGSFTINFRLSALGAATKSTSLSSLQVRAYIRDIATTAFTLIGRFLYGAVTLSGGQHLTLTVSGATSATTAFGATTRLFVDVIARAGTRREATIVTSQGATLMKIVTPGVHTPAPATTTWNTSIGGAAVGKSYSALVVIVHSTTSKVPHCVGAWDASLKSLHTYTSTFVSAFQQLANGTAKTWKAILPIANEPGDSLALKILWTAATKGTVTVYGLTANPGLQVRNDGRAFPSGQLCVGPITVTSKTTGTIIIAAVATLRILVRTMAIYPGATTSITFYTAKGTINGVTAKFGVSCGPNPNVEIPDEGLLLDVDTALLGIKSGTATGHALVTYDLVL